MLDGSETLTQVNGVIDFAIAESARILVRLRSVRAASDVITKAADELHGLLEQIEAAGAQSQSCELLAEARVSVQDSACGLKELTALDLIEHLNSVMRYMKELKFIAMMIKIDAAGPSHSRLKASAFADDLEVLVGTLDETTKMACMRVEPVQTKVLDSYQALQETALGLAQHVDQMSGLAGHTADLKRARDTQMSVLGKEARQVSSTTALQISRLVPRLQFADAFVQRLQNTQKFIEAADQHTEASREQVMAVASLQMKALMEDTRVERNASTDALDALFVATSESATELSVKDTADDFGEWLKASASVVQLNTKVIEESRRQLLSAFQHIEDANTVADQVSETISKFLPLVQTLKFTAINGSLMAAQSSSKKSASNVLTAEIQSVGKKCGQRMTDCAAALLDINKILSLVDRSKLNEQIMQLAENLGKAKITQENLLNLTREMNQTRRLLSDGVTALLDACKDARQTIQEGEAMLHGLDHLIDAGAGFDVGNSDSKSLEWITAYYTTEPERALHRKLFGGVLEPVAEILDDDDDLGDFLL